MKKTISLFSFAVVAFLFLPPSVSAQRFYVRLKPSRTVVTLRPVAPRPHYVWRDDEWVWDARSRQYVVVEGHWIEPRRGKVWIPGHWRDSRRGSYWIEGHWGRI